MVQLTDRKTTALEDRGILSDRQITELAEQGMVAPFCPTKIREIDFEYQGAIAHAPALSFGLGHYGLDLRLSPKEFKVFRHVPGTVVNPKCFSPANLESVELQVDQWGEFFILPAHSYGLGVALEHLSLPVDVTAIFIGKSTYVRCGVIVPITPAEAGWSGHLTLEFSNSSSADCRIYANEGIVQALFLRGEACSIPYGSGKYQGQSHEVTLAKV